MFIIGNGYLYLYVSFSSKPQKIRTSKFRVTVPAIRPITEEEFNSLDRLTRGRLTLEKVNTAIEEFHGLVEKKYQLLNTSASKIKEPQLREYNVLICIFYFGVVLYSETHTHILAA